MNSHYTPIKRNNIDDQLFTFNWPAVITLTVNTITQSGAFDYTQSVRSGAFVTLVIEHCLMAFFDVSNHQQSLISVTAFSKLVSEMSNSVKGYLNLSMSFPNTCTCKLLLAWSKQYVYMYKVNDVTNWPSQTTDNSKYFVWSPGLWDKACMIFLQRLIFREKFALWILWK